MRIWRATFSLILTIAIVYVLSTPFGTVPALGRLLDPISGALANAESVNEDFTTDFAIPGLQNPVSVSFDERLVPHIHAANDHDLYFAQGYIHAYFRLFQMDLQTRAAAGRVCEVIGKKALNFDRLQRRKGMVYAAENSLKAMEADPRTKQMLDAYRDGINAYITPLVYRQLPIEYKLIGFKPEPWTNIKSALLLKYMADDLTGYTEDIAQTVLRDRLGKDEFEKLFPEKVQGSKPVISSGTAFDKPSLSTIPVPADSNIWTHLETNDFEKQDNEGKGSNNWAVSGAKTKAGAPILCNDPHLGLNLPSLWYEVQLQAPGINVYGVSLPGAPGVVIGFNDNIAWGFTNNYRDVKDFYAIQPSADYSTYLFAGRQLPFDKRIEEIKIKGAPDFTDTVLYTLHGPLLYNEHFTGPGGLKRPLALSWMAHHATNELLCLYLLNRSNNYTEFTNAIQHFECPGQNMVYADKSDNIALWGQGQFVNKWKDQGRYVMNGTDSNTLWKQLIPMNENPHVFNPVQGYVASANQAVTDSTYPYWYNGYFYEFRSWRINQLLSSMQSVTVNDMFSLQNDVYSILAANVLPSMLNSIHKTALTAEEQEYVKELEGWNYYLNAGSKAAAIFQLWWFDFYPMLWKDKFSHVPDNLLPSSERTMQLLKTDTALMNRADKIAKTSFVAAIDSLHKVNKKGDEWFHVKNTSVTHLAKLAPFSYTDINIGGWGNVVNAAKANHGPSWRMVVQMGKQIEAYGVYPGGQSGNPGSKYYATFLDKWAGGQYYKLLFMENGKTQDAGIKYTWTIQPAKK